MAAVGCMSDNHVKTKSISLQIKPSSKTGQPQRAITVSLHKEHPRLLFTAADQRRVEKLARTNKFLAGLIVQLKKNAERMLSIPVITYKPRLRGKKARTPILLGTSRRCIGRITALAMTYRLTKDRRFFERARKEMLAAAAFKDWNPPHFLDTAEMTCALAIGYDWLFDTLSKKDRTAIRRAIVEKGLNRGIDAYTPGKVKWGWWTQAKMNWNQVCNGGLVMGALAIGEDEPKLAGEIISHALRSARYGLSSYKPDGAWFEGPGYWTYGTTYSVLMMASLESALGEDFGIAATPGLDKTGFYTLHLHCPNIKRQFNYSDGGAVSNISPVMFYLARKFNQPAFAWYECRQIQRIFDKCKVADGGEYKIKTNPSRFFALEIAWFDERGLKYDSKKLPLDINFRGRAHVAAMRSSWNDKYAMFVGFKGGNNALEHGHLDIGSFVFDTDDVRWAMDFGADTYNLHGYFQGRIGGLRWKYYRTMTKSHNTITIGGKNQRIFGTGKIIDFLSTPARAHAVVDMSDAYRKQVKKAMRGIAMIERSAVLVQDEITPLDDSEIRWGMVTLATIQLDGAKAILTKDGCKLEAEILAPAGAKFKIVSTAPATKEENPNKGTSMLAISVKPDGKKLVRIVVLLKPIGRCWKKIPTPKIQPLSKWKTMKNDNAQ